MAVVSYKLLLSLLNFISASIYLKRLLKKCRFCLCYFVCPVWPFHCFCIVVFYNLPSTFSRPGYFMLLYLHIRL